MCFNLQEGRQLFWGAPMLEVMEPVHGARHALLERARPVAMRFGREAADLVYDRTPIAWNGEVVEEAVQLYREAFVGPELPRAFADLQDHIRNIGVQAYEQELRALVARAKGHT
jgi:hypothetical protein